MLFWRETFNYGPIDCEIWRLILIFERLKTFLLCIVFNVSLFNCCNIEPVFMMTVCWTFSVAVIWLDFCEMGGWWCPDSTFCFVSVCLRGSRAAPGRKQAGLRDWSYHLQTAGRESMFNTQMLPFTIISQNHIFSFCQFKRIQVPGKKCSNMQYLSLDVLICMRSRTYWQFSHNL